MSRKIITVSLPKCLEWKLSQLSKKTSIPKSVLIARSILLLVSDLTTYVFKGGEMGQDYTIEDIEQEYQEYLKGVADGRKTTKADR